MDLVDFFRVIIRWKWLVFTLLFLVAGYSLFGAMRSQEKYRAETTIVTGLSQITLLSSGGADIGGINVAQLGDNIAATYAEVITSQPVINKALKQAGLDWPVETLRAKISTSISKDTPVLKVSVEDTNSDRATLLANALSESFVEYIKDTSRATLDSTKFRLTQELTAIEKEISVEKEASESSGAKIKVLEDKRDLIMREYNKMLELEFRAGDVNLVDPAGSSKAVETKSNQKALVVFIVGMAMAVVAAFVAEAGSRALKATYGEGA